jgi:hypothetical protein
MRKKVEIDMLHTYEAVLKKGQIRWIDSAPTEQSAHLWITLLPEKVKSLKPSAMSEQQTQHDIIKRLTLNPVEVPVGVSFFSREQANAR